MEKLVITGVGSDLQGVGRLDDGRVAFVPGAIPGETVAVTIEKDRGRFLEASIYDVLEPSGDRVVPPCPHAGACGGCQARHMRYERTLDLKRQVVVDALTRIGGLEAPIVRPTLGSEPRDRTRNKAEYPIAEQNGHWIAGVHDASGRGLIPISDCLLQKPESVRALNLLTARLDGTPGAAHLRYLVTRVSQSGDLMAVLCADAPISGQLEPLYAAFKSDLPELKSLYFCQLNRRPAHALDGKCTCVYGEPALTETLMGLSFTVSPQSFFQVNKPQAERLYQLALEAIGIAPGCGLRVLDAYCGTGTITLAAARWADFATGVELVPPAIADAKANAKRHGLTHKARFICADAAKALPKLLACGERFDAAILDPPRKGADPALLDALAAARVPTLVYVSCNPATLARDVKRLTGAGYRFQWAQPLDMFPWTGHVETVCLLTHKD